MPLLSSDQTYWITQKKLNSAARLNGLSGGKYGQNVFKHPRGNPRKKTVETNTPIMWADTSEEILFLVTLSKHKTQYTKPVQNMLHLSSL